MAKTNQPRGKLVRKFGKIFSCPIDKLANRKPISAYSNEKRKSIQLWSSASRKAKIKFMYGLLEKQFRITFKKLKNQRRGWHKYASIA